MSTTGGPEEIEADEPNRRTVLAPYTSKHPVPTVKKYYAEQEQRRHEEYLNSGESLREGKGLGDRVKEELGLSDPEKEKDGPYQSTNRNDFVPPPPEQDQKDDSSDESENDSENQKTDNNAKDTTEAHIAHGDARQKRKAMKKREPKGTRVVTDPVTHLQVAIHDFTGKELDHTPENLPAPGQISRTNTSGTKSDDEIADEQEEADENDKGVRRVFPPPSFDRVRDGLVSSTRKALIIWVALVTAFVIVAALILWADLSRGEKRESGFPTASTVSILIIIFAFVGLIFSGMVLYTWLTNQIRRSWDDDVWQAARREEAKQAQSPAPESTQWLNRLLSSVWPLINPDLFVSMADTIEDVMQASLPRLIRMVAVEDFGQGSESIRILGVRWLPTGAAAKTVDMDGNVSKDDPGQENGQVNENDEKGKDGSNNDSSGSSDSAEQNITEGLKKEEGEFVNMEVGFSYRARENDKRLSKRIKNAHLLIKFYLPGSLPIPIWVTLQGLVGVVRMRLQLTPDPPFIALATITLVGQPKAEMQAIPLTKHFLNVMDLPFISGFVQSSIDAALAEYVAPRSLTLNLKEMLMGDDFKKDTIARGVVIVHVKRAYDFKEADVAIPGVREGSADPYITVGWAKFGKPVWSSRVILKSMTPVWDEAAFLLVTPEELNAGERIRIQLWDSDRLTADDDVGRIEVDLKEVMHGRSRGTMWDRKDGFLSMQNEERMPGTLEWSIGYFPKVRLTQKQIKQQKLLPDIEDRQALKTYADKEAERKTREASTRDMHDEIEQNKETGLHEKEIAMAAAATPPEGYPSGIFSIQLHNITGLNLQVLRKDRDQQHNEGAEASEVSEELPSAYATVIINGQRVFKTRTKPKNVKPFYNASTERFIRDWRHTEVIIAVHDARVHEDDALIGLVYLNLGEVFSKKSQVDNSYPLVGGIGFGRFRISMVFKATTLQLPRQFLGWEYGTLEIAQARSNDLPQDLQGMRLKVKGPLGKGRLRSKGGADSVWEQRKGENLKIGVAHRYSSCITFEFRKTVSGPNKTAAFGVFWLKDIADAEGKSFDVAIWRGGRSKEFERARTHCIEDCTEDRAGTLTVDMKFWPGLAEYHRDLASKNPNLRNVMEVLDTARDNDLVKTELYERRTKTKPEESGSQPDGRADASDSEESSDDDRDGEEIAMHNGNEYYDNSDDDDDDDDKKSEEDETEKIEEPATLRDSRHPQESGTGASGDGAGKGEDDGSRNPIQQLRDYRAHEKTLNRQHKGAMQWRLPRTAKWMKHKAESGRDRVIGAVAHHDREPDIETEV